ncbi:MAG: B12-binding domain-containing radical SAM protein [Thermodesulfobacteriota bacterium]
MTLSHPVNVLLVNPWIHDVAAYDFWARPMGLLQIGARLRRAGARVTLLDCLNRFHPGLHPTDPALRYGRGPYPKQPIAKPAVLSDVPRRFCRYGVPPELIRSDLASMSRPDIVLVTSFMTYWYPGVIETIREIRSVFGDVPIVLGGIYARLCPEHARMTSGADRVVDHLVGEEVLPLVAEMTGTVLEEVSAADVEPFPAFELLSVLPFVPILTTTGCPFSCAYCASAYLNPIFRRRPVDVVVGEIRFWHETRGVCDFVLYDDAFLIDAAHHALPLLEAVIRLGLYRRIRFHTPNALHVREIDTETAHLLFRSGFKTVRLGLETTLFGPDRPFDVKVQAEDFLHAAHSLRQAGFERHQLGAYLLAGCPDQSEAEVLQAIRAVKAVGLTPIPAYYTPIPHTGLWERACAVSRYPLADDPIYTNNAIFPCLPQGFSWDWIRRLKEAIHDDP